MSRTNDAGTAGPLTEEAIKRTYPDYDDQVVSVETQPPESASRRMADDHLSSEVAAGLDRGLYTHQAEALDLLADGENVTVATSTASGKTWVYGLHMAREHLESDEATGLFVFPTKALTNNQLENLRDLYDDLGLDLRVMPYDGDTDQDVKRSARDDADVILTNFAGLNQYLSFHSKWARFLSNLEVITIDESHTYKAVHGMHVAWILRRLKRLVAEYGGTPQFVCTTATIGNPQEHTEKLIGEATTVVDNDGSPSGERNILFWNPTEELEIDNSGDDDEIGGATAAADAAALTAHLALHDVQTLTFNRSRKGTELGARYSVLAKLDHPQADEDDYIQVEPYHAGLGKRTRRQTEMQFKNGILDAVVSTNALELGIDIGGVDATVLTGYPGTRQSFFQQIGRGGRGTDTALAAFVARNEAIDQYVVNHPEYLFEDAVEDAVIDLSNNKVFAPHILCAADELPLTEQDKQYFGQERLEQAVEMYRRMGRLQGTLTSGVTYTGTPRPQSGIDIYASSDTQFTVTCEEPGTGIDHDTVDKERAYRDYHEGALFLHDGEQWRVVDLDEDAYQPTITVEPAGINEYTQSMGDIEVSKLTRESQTPLDEGVSREGGISLQTGEGRVSTHYIAYNQREIGTGNITAAGVPIDLPPIELNTQLLWLTFNDAKRSEYLFDWSFDSEPAAEEAFSNNELGDELEAGLQYDHSVPATHQARAVQDFIITSGLHAAEHALIKTAPLDLRMSKDDLGGLSTSEHPETGAPTLFMYDGIDGGLGFSHRIAENLASVADRAHERVTECDCTGGCPACVMDSQCGSRNQGLFPQLAVMILDDLRQSAGIVL